MTSMGSCPPAPHVPPEPSPADRLWSRVLPGPLRPKWALDILKGCWLEGYEGARRDDIRIDWIHSDVELGAAHREFLSGHTSRTTRFRWMRYLRKGTCWLALAWWQDAIRHFTLVQVTGGPAFSRFAPVLRADAAFVGPVYTTPDARGQGIYPFVLSQTLMKLGDAGSPLAYISFNYQNEASRRGIEKDKAWQDVARILLRRPPGRLYFRTRAVTVETPEMARASSIHS